MNNTAEELWGLPTLQERRCCDCKVDTGYVRVWICRSGWGITVEELVDGHWRTVECSDSAQANLG